MRELRSALFLEAIEKGLADNGNLFVMRNKVGGRKTVKENMQRIYGSWSVPFGGANVSLHVVAEWELSFTNGRRVRRR